MIEVVHDKEPRWMPAEPCALCNTPTRYWYAPKDVAVCPECAKGANPEDVPSKRAWLVAHGASLPPEWKCAADRRAESLHIAAKG